MKLQRSTLVLVSVALLMGAGVLIAESQRTVNSEGTEQVASGETILAFAETDVTGLVVERNGETLSFELDDEGNWQMTEPDTTVAEPGAVAYLLSRLNTDAPLETVTMQPDQLADFGFDDPSGQVTVTLADGTEHQLFLGSEDFSGNARYVIIDPETWPLLTDGEAEYTVLVVSQDVANGINRPLAEWKLPAETASEATDDAAGDAETGSADADADVTDEQGTADSVDEPADPEATGESEPEAVDTDDADSDAAADPADPEASDDPESSAQDSDAAEDAAAE